MGIPAYSGLPAVINCPSQTGVKPNETVAKLGVGVAVGVKLGVGVTVVVETPALKSAFNNNDLSTEVWFKQLKGESGLSI